MATAPDTIAAISTPTGEGGIAIIRLSGPRALQIADRVVTTKTPLSRCASHTLHYGKMMNRDGTVVDEVIVSIMRAPRSYTREDVVEINCHAGVVTAHQCLESVIAAGAKLAEPGEFTKRAFLNGRIDLTRAEAVASVIRAQSLEALRVAQDLLAGRLQNELEKISSGLVEIVAHLEASLDFTEEDIDPPETGWVTSVLESSRERLNQLLETERHGRLLESGAKVALIGKPNVGKSSLLNTLIGKDRAITDRRPGTTRDTVEGSTVAGGITLRVTDTAGVRKTSKAVEVAGIERSWRAVDDADLVLWVLDGSRPLDHDDYAVAEKAGKKGARLAVANKSDLGRFPGLTGELKRLGWPTPPVGVSALTSDGIGEMKRAMINLLGSGAELGSGRLIIGTARQAQGIREASTLIGEALAAAEQGAGEEIVSQITREALSAIGKLTGVEFGEAVLDEIFSNFCIGK